MNSIERLKNLFKNFPTVGPRTAGRFVYYLAKQPKEKIDELISAINDLKTKIKLCPLCFNPFEMVEGPTFHQFCGICSDSRRDQKMLCIVEKEADLLTIENTKKYNGLYFILGGTISTMKKEDVSQLRTEELKKRIKGAQQAGGFTEIIVALNPTPEGKTTSVLVENLIKEIFLSADPGQMPRITHLAKGIPVGGELEYADEETLESALSGRK